jgi:hypothetical protein
MEVVEMQSGLMPKPSRAATIVAVVLALGALAAFALLSASAHTAQAAVGHAGKHAVHHARHHAARKSTEQTTATDGDNVQSGDQTAPGETSGESSGETSGESSVESEQGQPGEPANGHQDTGPNANNDCTGNCVQ